MSWWGILFTIAAAILAFVAILGGMAYFGPGVMRLGDRVSCASPWATKYDKERCARNECEDRGGEFDSFRKPSCSDPK